MYDFFIFSEKKIPKQIFTRVLWTCLSSFTSWLKILKEVCRISLDDVKAWKRSLPCHSPLLSNSTYSSFFYFMGIKGWEVSLFLVVTGFNKYYHCNIRLQSHQNFNKHYSFFFVLWNSWKKKKRLSLENFLCIFLQMKTFVKKVHLWKVLTYLKKKKILLYTCSHNYAEINGKFLKKANVRQRKVNTVHLLRTSSTIRFTVFPVLIIEAISTLNLQKPWKAQLVWLRGCRGTKVVSHMHSSAANSCTNQISFKYPHAHTHAPVTGVAIILHGCFINLLSRVKK